MSSPRKREIVICRHN